MNKYVDYCTLIIFFCCVFVFYYIGIGLPDLIKQTILPSSDDNKTGGRENVVKNLVRSSGNYSSNATSELAQAIHNKEIEESNGMYSDGVLVRKRRFLIFPEGSSFQLVFCNTYFTIIPIADIFYMGATASLAWELPQDPYSPFDHHADALHRKDKGPVVYTDVKGSNQMNKWGKRILVNKYTGEKIQPFSKDYYNKAEQFQSNKILKEEMAMRKRKGKHRKMIINPVFAKRSADLNLRRSNRSVSKKKRATLNSIDVEEMHREHSSRDHLNADGMEESEIDFHRISRYGLYEKIEKLIFGIGSHGKECVLKALCEIGQDSKGEQGTFLEEILRVVFTLPKARRVHSKYKHYDDAHSIRYTCANVYPKCNFSIKSLK